MRDLEGGSEAAAILQLPQVVTYMLVHFADVEQQSSLQQVPSGTFLTFSDAWARCVWFWV